MPYSGAGDESLPDYVKELSEDKRAQWVAVFNSAYESCIEDDGKSDECESSAFAQANGVVMKEEESKKTSRTNREAITLRKIWDAIRSVFAQDKEIDGALKRIKDQAVALSDIYTQVAYEVYEYDDWGWLMDIFREDDGQMFAVIASEGKLYKALITLQEDEDEGGMEYSIPPKDGWEEVLMEFVPAERSKTTIIRQTNGKIRGFMISSTSTLNRNGEIDSKKLHENLNRRAEESGKYPYIDFFHLGKKTRIGQADFLALEENVAICSFLFDDPETNELARAFIASCEKDPEYWGASISYYPKGEIEILRIADVSINVYSDGEYEAITVLPEKYAASWLTAVPAINMEVNQRMNKRVEEAILKLADGDEELLKKLSGIVDGANQTITSNKMLTREGQAENLSEEIVMETQEEAVVVVDQEENEAVAEVVEAAPAESVEQAAEFVLDDSAVEAISSHVLQSMQERDGNQIASLVNQMSSLATQIAALSTELVNLRSNVQRLSKTADELKKEAEEQTQERENWQVDLPRREVRATRVTYRPSNQNTTLLNSAPHVPAGTFADVAESTLANIK